jgi:integrase
MKNQFTLYRRSNGTFYCQDTVSGKQQSLGTKNEVEAQILLHSKNEASRQPILNHQIALAYLSGTDPEAAKRTWKFVMDEMTATKTGETHYRHVNAMKDVAFDLIRDVPLLETRAEHILKVLRTGTVSTNIYLRRLHNFALDMNWLPKSVLPRKQWPKPVFKDKRAITLKEHEAIVAREMNPERRSFYQLVWHIGAAQTDLALLKAEDIDWKDRVIGFFRKKTQSVAILHFGPEVESILRALPSTGQLFPYLCRVRASDRATEFKQRCAGLGIKGVTLHSYRYAWAERARKAGYPERFAQEALGHNSKAVHRSYARRAQVTLPTLEEYERKIIPLQQPNTPSIMSSQSSAIA